MSQKIPPTQAQTGYVEPETIARLGHPPQPHQPRDTWQFSVLDFVPNINPASYFCTSGEAVIKAKKLEQDLWHAAAAARKFVNILTKTRAKHKYLEFQITGDRFSDGRQMSIVKTKDPRPNQRLIAKQKSRFHS